MADSCSSRITARVSVRDGKNCVSDPTFCNIAEFAGVTAGTF